MKARLIIRDNALQILFCTGRIRNVDFKEAFDFLFSYDAPTHYSGPGKWNEKVLPMQDYKGETIAVVDDDGRLRIENAEQFRTILDLGKPELITANEYAKRHEKDETRIRKLCREERIPGAQLKGTVWLIPENAPYPSDERARDGRRWGAKR